MCDTGPPLVSVVMSAYNEEEHIRESVNSALEQTFENVEVVVVDDGSTDKTQDILQSISSPNLNVIINKHNLGLPKSLNKGIWEASGKYIARMDADEYSKHTRIEKQVKYMKENSGKIVAGCWYDVIGNNNKNIITKKIDPDTNFSVNNLIKNGPIIAHGSVIMERGSLIEIGGYRQEFVYAQDYDLWLRIADNYGAHAIGVVPESLYERRISPSQIQNRKKTIICSEYAKKCVELDRPQDDLLQELKYKLNNTRSDSLSERSREAAYHYLVATHYLRSGNRIEFYRSILRSILKKPTLMRPWYQIACSLLPSGIREPVRRAARSLVARL